MKQNISVFDETIAENYDDLLGPFIFEPYAVDIIERVDLSGVKKVLEIASGTGRVTRHLFENLQPGTLLTATDLNPGMIALARERINEDSILWQTADMSELPFADSQFDIVVCQFGIMFAPDKAQALKEMRRVLKKGGELIFSTWGPIEENVAWQITSNVIRHYTGHASNDTFKDGPFSMSNEKDVLELLKQAGFFQRNATAVYKEGKAASAKIAAHGFIHGLPVVKVIQRNNDASVQVILKELQGEFIKQLGDSPLKTPLQAWVFRAIK